MARYDLATTNVGQLLADPAAVDIIERHYPGITHNPMVGMVRGMAATKAFALASDYVSADEIASIRAELEHL
ncbi:MAG: hypothetical protein ACLGHZ_04690 [Actinomycetes bacterium]